MAEAIKNPESRQSLPKITNLWGQVAQQSRKEVTQGFSYDPELVAAIIRSDIDNINQIQEGTHNHDNELSFKQYDFLIRKFGLKVLQNPVLFAALLAEEELNNGNS
ncbi:MAG: hypothetical protein COB66_09000 [Coxiella sp. (in: Bacteria)]|nr:MAG: hypothetical protein COB66_09000 [Coxiella sp. (in: g-proteobacteria)]